MCNETVLNQHFDLLEKELRDLINKPHLTFYANEKGINLDAKNGKVVVTRNTKHTYVESKGMRDHITVDVCCSAAGQKLPPFMTFQTLFPSSAYSTQGPENAVYTKSPNGYIDEELFLAQLTEIDSRKIEEFCVYLRKTIVALFF